MQSPLPTTSGGTTNVDPGEHASGERCVKTKVVRHNLSSKKEPRRVARVRNETATTGTSGDSQSCCRRNCCLSRQKSLLDAHSDRPSQRRHLVRTSGGVINNARHVFSAVP